MLGEDDIMRVRPIKIGYDDSLDQDGNLQSQGSFNLPIFNCHSHVSSVKKFIYKKYVNNFETLKDKS